VFLASLDLGLTLDIGCGIGRNLKNICRVVGVDINNRAVQIAKENGLDAYTLQDFQESKWAREGLFDSLLFSHVLEHMDKNAAKETVKFYLPFLRKQGSVVLIAPQERGYRSDLAHLTFMDFEQLVEMLASLKVGIVRTCSFPFPRVTGRFFKYNEFVVIGRKCS